MNRVTILTTDENAETFEDFELNGSVFEFRKLTADGPTALIDGTAWVFVDWVMDDLSGLEMCRRLRADPRTREAHVTMVLEHDDPDDRRRALKAGADDYMIGRAGRQAILDRILALNPSVGLRGLSQVIEAGNLRIDLGAEQVRWGGRPVLLRPNEFRLLRFLAVTADAHHGRVHRLQVGIGVPERAGLLGAHQGIGLGIEEDHSGPLLPGL